MTTLYPNNLGHNQFEFSVCALYCLYGRPEQILYVYVLQHDIYTTHNLGNLALCQPQRTASPLMWMALILINGYKSVILI